MKLSGKTALITGAAKRIGREIALTLAECGANIVIHYRDSRQDALTLKKQIEGLGVQASLIACDFSPEKKSLENRIQHFVSDVYRNVESVDLLINNASVFYPTPFGKISEKSWDDFLTVNLKAPFFLSQEIGNRMFRKKSGKIIHLADSTAFRPNENYIPYAVSKAGLVAANAGLAKALAPYVQVNCIAPGPILPAKGMSQSQKKQVAERTLLKRFGDPRDIAAAVRFFAEGTDFVTGAFLPVDGGSLIA